MKTDELNECAERATRGDRMAEQDLLKALRPAVERYCRLRLGAQERPVLSPEDLTQEILIAVVTALHRYQATEGSVTAFVYGIAAHKVTDALRVIARTRTFTCADPPDRTGPEPGPEERAMDAAGSPLVRDALSHLPDRQREVLVLRTMMGLSVETTAEAVGCSAGAVRIAQHRALTALRELLSGPSTEEVA